MIQFSANIQACLARDNIEAFYLVKITNADGTIFNGISSTSYFVDVTLIGDTTTYVADGLILGADAPQISSTVEKNEYKLVLADPGFLLGPTVQTSLVGKHLETRLGFVDTITGSPYLNKTDTFVIYSGTIDSVAYDVDTKELGEVRINIIGSSPLVNLDQKRALYLSRDAVRKRNSNDSSCDQIYMGSGALIMKWGKA